jgi:hypothetical protein
VAQSVHVSLVAHAANPQRFHQRVDATLAHTADGGLAVAYAIHGLNLDLRVPTPHAPAPADALWKTTCCELFVGPSGRPGYREFNFSPSGQWAAYDFLDYRERKPGSPACHAPSLQTRRTEDLLQLDVQLPPHALPKMESDSLRIALSVVLEANDGNLGYWALGHAAGKPDFHRAGFLLCLGPAGLRPARCA